MRSIRRAGRGSVRATGRSSLSVVGAAAVAVGVPLAARGQTTFHTYDVPAGQNVSIGSTPDGGILKTGPGDLTMGGGPYDGPTIINEGRVIGTLGPNSPVTLGGGRYIIVGTPFFNEVTRVAFGGTALTLNPGSSGIFSQVGRAGIMQGGGTEVTVPDTWVRNPGASLFVYLGVENQKSGTVVSNPLPPVATATPTTAVLGYAWVRDSTGYGFAYVDGAGHVVPYHAGTTITTSTDGPVLTLNPATNYQLVVDSDLTLDLSSTPTANTLELAFAGQAVARKLDLNGKTLSLTTGGLLANNGLVTVDNGRLGAPDAELLIHSRSGLTLGPGLQLSGGTGSVVIDGDPTIQFPGDVVFNGNTSTFSGGVRLAQRTSTVVNASSVTNNGTLVSGPFGTGTLTIQGGWLRTGSAAPVRIDNPVTLNSDLAIPAGGQKLTFGGPVTLTGSASRAVGAGGTPVEFAGPIGDGGAGIGLGLNGVSIVMSGANTYTGPTGISPGSSVTFAARQDIGDVTVNPGATALFQTSQHVKTLDVGGNATLTPHGAGPLKVISATGLRATGRLDLTDNAIAIRASTVSGSSALLQNMTALIKSGRDGGPSKWTGFGLVSSNAANDPRTGLGVMFNANAQGQPTFPTLGGETLTSNDVIARWTFLGDANLDGMVGGGDFNLLAAHFGQTGQTWQSGDFNLDGTVGGGDFNLLAANFGLALPGLSPNVTASDWAALQAFGATAAPEPAAATVFALASLVPGLMRRRLRQS